MPSNVRASDAPKRLRMVLSARNSPLDFVTFTNSPGDFSTCRCPLERLNRPRSSGGILTLNLRSRALISRLFFLGSVHVSGALLVASLYDIRKRSLRLRILVYAVVIVFVLIYERHALFIDKFRFEHFRVYLISINMYGEDIQPNRREFIPKAMRAMRKHVSHTHHDVARVETQWSAEGWYPGTLT